MAHPAAPRAEITARDAGLHHSSDARPGITRRRSGRGFTYRDRDGATIRDEKTLARIRSLAIPPAWTEVWICPSPLGHIQATGRDARGRKQYRYHPRWRVRRDAGKFERMLEFADALPAIRARCDADLALPGLPREKVLAAVVRLLELTLIRVGNDEYARLNKSFGLTTLQDRHAVVEGSKVHFRFRAKSGKIQEVDLKDRRLARLVKRCQELPGQELFQYIDDDGEVRDVASDDVNAYLREATGGGFTAKDFRTWAGTLLAFRALSSLGPAQGKTASRKNVLHAIRQVADGLGNTPTVARGSYVHPAVVDAYLEGSLRGALLEATEEEATPPERPTPEEEQAMVALLRRRQREQQRELRERGQRRRPPARARASVTRVRKAAEGARTS
jgi:DNA topoisomerase-1